MKNIEGQKCERVGVGKLFEGIDEGFGIVSEQDIKLV
jgi:hypothetical protein